MSDKNYKSYDGPQENVSDVILDPVAAGWPLGSWDDTLKFNRRQSCIFEDFVVVCGGREDAVDISCRNVDNRFRFFNVSSNGKYVLTLKGKSRFNEFFRWIITKPGRWVDVQIGNWHDDDANWPINGSYSDNNLFMVWARTDGKPIRYAYRWGCRPLWEESNVKHLWWMSAGMSLYWWGKYLWTKCKSPRKTG